MVEAVKTYPRLGKLCMSGYFGDCKWDVMVLGETPKRFRIQAPEGKSVKLAGRNRYISGPITALVPKHAVEFAK